MRFSYLSFAGAITLEVLARGVNFASALKHDVSRASSTTELVRKDTRVLKKKRFDDIFSAVNGPRSLEAVDPDWQPEATNLFQTPDYRCWGASRISMSADGKTFAIGCYADNNNTGKLKVFHKVDGQWEQKGEDINGLTSGELLGRNVSLSANGSVLAVSSYKRANESSEVGCIQVYQYMNDAWIPMGEQIDGINQDENFGFQAHLSADGLTLVGSGEMNNKSDHTSEGLVRVYRYANNQWEQLGDTFFGQDEKDYLGGSISLSGDGQVLALGTGGDNEATGSISVFQYVNDEWVKMGQTLHGDSHSNFGVASQISSDATTMIVGATHWSPLSATQNTGYVEVYRFIEGQWKLIGDRFTGAHNVYYGFAVYVSSDGSIIAIPSPMEGEDPEGVVRVYEYSGSQWEQLGGEVHGTAAALSANGRTLAASLNYLGVSIFKFPPEEWDGSWFIDYDSAALSGDVLTSTYLTKPGVGSGFTVSHTVGACNTNGAPLVDSSVITNVDSTPTVVDDEMSDTLSVAKTLNAAAIAEDHDGELNFCETVALTNAGASDAETVDVVQAQSYYTVTANFLAEIGTYSSVTLVDESSVTIVDEQSLSPEGTIAVKRCADLTDSINPGDKLCLEIYVSDSQTVGVERIHNLDLKQGTSTFAAIDNGVNQYSALVEESCADGTCTVDIVVPDSLFTDESGASELTLSITGDAYLYEKGGAKDEDENESKAFSYSVKLEKPCKGGLRGFVENLLS